jgi:myo-inositol-1(or 4)-monophosphatase
MTRKSAEGDLVTSADRLVEAEISGRIRRAFPDHGVFGEEGTSVPTTGEWVWRIDPIDGTNNYAYGSPVFGTAVSLHRRGETVVAAIAHHETVVVATKGERLKITELGKARPAAGGEPDVPPAVALWLGYGTNRLATPLVEILAVLNRNARRTFESWAPTADTILYLRGGVDVVVGYRCSGEELLASLFVLASDGAAMKTLSGKDFSPSSPPELFVAGRPDKVSAICREIAFQLSPESSSSGSTSDSLNYSQ